MRKSLSSTYSVAALARTTQLLSRDGLHSSGLGGTPQKKDMAKQVSRGGERGQKRGGPACPRQCSMTCHRPVRQGTEQCHCARPGGDSRLECRRGTSAQAGSRQAQAAAAQVEGGKPLHGETSGPSSSQGAVFRNALPQGCAHSRQNHPLFQPHLGAAQQRPQIVARLHFCRTFRQGATGRWLRHAVSLKPPRLGWQYAFGAAFNARSLS